MPNDSGISTTDVEQTIVSVYGSIAQDPDPNFSMDVPDSVVARFVKEYMGSPCSAPTCATRAVGAVFVDSNYTPLCAACLEPLRELSKQNSAGRGGVIVVDSVRNAASVSHAACHDRTIMQGLCVECGSVILATTARVLCEPEAPNAVPMMKCTACYAKNGAGTSGPLQILTGPVNRLLAGLVYAKSSDNAV